MPPRGMWVLGPPDLLPRSVTRCHTGQHRPRRWLTLSSLCHSGHEKLIDPDTFRDFYTCWKEAEAEVRELSLPAEVLEQLDKHERVSKLSSSVRTSRGVGRIAMTQKRLFLLAEGRPGFTEISTFRDIEVRAPPGPRPSAARRGQSFPCGGHVGGDCDSSRA